jgi:CDP-diacylglycerol pyrophosphatase
MIKASLVILALLAAAAIAAMTGREWLLSQRQDPNALWRIAQLCARDQAANHLPAPCLTVDLPGGYVVLKDRVRGPEVMVMPTVRVTGIEDPAVRGPDAPNYWQGAWLARRYVEKFAGRRLPRDDVAMAINSVYGRSQNQLHIHVDCIQGDVKEALAANLARIGPTWSRFTLELHDHDYHAMWLPGADLSGRNPFDLLARRHGARNAGRRACHEGGRHPGLRSTGLAGRAPVGWRGPRRKSARQPMRPPVGLAVTDGDVGYR